MSLQVPQGQTFQHHGITVFPSFFVDALYHEIFRSQSDNNGGLWFRVKNGPRSLLKSQRINDSVRNGDVLEMERYDPGANYAQGPAALASFRVKIQTGSNPERVEVLRLYLDQTVEDLKWAIRCRDPEWPMSVQRIVFRATELTDNSRLRNHNIGNHCLSLFKRYVAV